VEFLVLVLYFELCLLLLQLVLFSANFAAVDFIAKFGVLQLVWGCLFYKEIGDAYHANYNFFQITSHFCTTN
jgi:hypothetical protein